MKTDKSSLLEKALDLFSDRGFQYVTITDIGATVGVTGAALYRHFRSKGDVLGQLCEMTLDRLTECVGPEKSNPREELDALIDGQVRFVVRYPKLLTVTQAEGRALETPWRATIEKRQRAHLKRWKKSLGNLHPQEDVVSIDVAIYGAIGLINSATRWPSTLRSRPDFEERLIEGAHQVIDTLIRTRVSESV
ncbi:MAG: TetR/AcrR family transcriptional regulator [Xanthobacteraceae bacterium]